MIRVFSVVIDKDGRIFHCVKRVNSITEEEGWFKDDEGDYYSCYWDSEGGMFRSGELRIPFMTLEDTAKMIEETFLKVACSGEFTDEEITRTFNCVKTSLTIEEYCEQQEQGERDE